MSGYLSSHDVADVIIDIRNKQAALNLLKKEFGPVVKSYTKFQNSILRYNQRNNARRDRERDINPSIALALDDNESWNRLDN